jgi:hypothetical protein
MRAFVNALNITVVRVVIRAAPRRPEKAFAPEIRLPRSLASDGTSAVLRPQRHQGSALDRRFGFRQINGGGIERAFSDGSTLGLDTDATLTTFRPQ